MIFRFLKWLTAERENITCMRCGKDVFGGEYFCAECVKALPFHTVFCPQCGRKVAQGGVCLDCKREPPHYRKGRSVFEYEGEAKRLVLAFKEGSPYLAKAFSRYAESVVLREFSDADGIVFVPMRKDKERERGYNQSELLAVEISVRTGVPVWDVFEKVKDTEQQKRLALSERKGNVKGTYHLKKRAQVRGKTVLIVDDTMTTGATVDELAKLLVGADAKKVYVFTVASVGYKPKDGEILQNVHTITLPIL